MTRPNSGVYCRVVVASAVLVLMCMTEVPFAVEIRVVGGCVLVKVLGNFCGPVVRCW
jgi:hypothetical protein